MRKHIVVIGAGIGGLSAAIRLAAAGQQVTVVEKNSHVGGKMGEVRREGFRWDTGPSVITMRPVFEELFQAAGRRLEEYIELLPVEPLTRYFYGDGTVLDATRDLARMVEQIRRLDAHDVEGYLAYLSYVARLHRVTGPAFIYGAPPTWRTVTQVAPADALRLEPWLTMDAAIRRYVRSPHLRQLLGRFATYVGGSPFRAPATLNVIAHVELNEGIWYPRGGVYAIAAGLERLARELGVTIRTGCAVARIHVPGTSEAPGLSGPLQATGVVLADGERIAADAVLSNVDVAHTLTNLLPREAVDLGRLRRLTRAEPSCSGFILLLGVRGEFPQLAQHNIFFSSDYPREFDDIFRRGVPPDEPTVYVAITSKADPGHAPPGHENWFVLVNAPAIGQERVGSAGERRQPWDWEQEKAPYRNRVLATLARFGLDVRQRIVVEEIFTPADLARQTGSWRGALYGASPNNMLAAFRRPPVRDPRVVGLYYAGGTTHPGGGVPMVVLSGRLAAKTILADLYRADNRRGARRAP
ncbi:MAG: phytoene desaturase family protein [Anaerolineae bacterium]